jgi:hypothetical protein
MRPTQGNVLAQFPDVYSKERRKSAMALRWEAGEFAEEKAD